MVKKKNGVLVEREERRESRGEKGRYIDRLNIVVVQAPNPGSERRARRGPQHCIQSRLQSVSPPYPYPSEGMRLLFGG